jgi:hypothetical protein
MKATIPATKLKAVWLEFPAGNRAYGGGGWSRRAKHRPAPERRELITTDVIETTGKSVIIAGRRKLKVNLYVAATGAVVRADYPLDGLTEFGLTTRQIAARKRVAAAKAAKAEAEAIAKVAANDAALAQKLAENSGAVAAWIAAGCVHPCPTEVMAAKKLSGLTWAEFQKGATL